MFTLAMFALSSALSRVDQKREAMSRHKSMRHTRRGARKASNGRHALARFKSRGDGRVRSVRCEERWRYSEVAANSPSGRWRAK